jgi:hypothetical protein
MKPERLSPIGITLMLAAGLGVASAQTVPVPAPVAQPVASAPTASMTTTSSTTTPPPASSGAFDALSTGNQKIARALYEAQRPSSTDGTTATKSLTLDEIAAMKQSGQGGWGQVFKDMKSQGLVQEKNLGQVVSQGQRHQPVARGEITTAGNRTVDRDTARQASIDRQKGDVSKHGTGAKRSRTETTSGRGHAWTGGGHRQGGVTATSSGGQGRSASTGHGAGRSK